MNRIADPALPAERWEEALRLAAVETPLDTSDAPKTVDWAHAECGRFAGQRQLAVTLWLDAGVVDYFARGGAGYEMRLNAALPEWVATRLAD